MGRSAARGFSLIELLLVVAIIGIIAAVVVPRIAPPTAATRTAVGAHQRGQLNTLVELYQAQEGEWPTSLADLVPDYLPEGVPEPPNGGAYSLNSTTHRVE